MMTWNPRANDLFLRASELLSADERQAFLEKVCAGDAALRAEVESLLEASARAGRFLESPALAAHLVGTVDDPISERPGTVIGPYKLLQQIGEGGMGAVFMAEQNQPVQRKVALKIIKPGMDSRQVLARFEVERQALAMMEHQNIAKVYDAGTTASGRPYFVMELVHGVPITQFCDDRKLTPRERLELFVPVCQAIQHAHQKGIIHRDIKPCNVLVTMYDDKPVPKVIDFGVAKAIEHRLTDKTMFTQFGALIGTLEYMSPEQAEMNAFGVDTRSDIYALGVLLYELLTGTTPLERQRLCEAALDEMVRLIKEEEAPRPSIRLSSSNSLPKIAAARNTEPAQLSKLIRGDIDWIVMKCLEKDRTRRYESANNLARDIQRHLADEPVEACPPSVGYRLRKFARKYRTPLRVAGAFLMLLVLGVIVSTWQAIRATVAEGVAQEREQVADDAKQQAVMRSEELAALNEKLRRANYIADMNLAQHAWDANNLIRTRELLELHRPKPGETDLRGFEWHYLRRFFHRELRIVQAHNGASLAVAFTPDGKRLITSGYREPHGEAREIRQWDAATLQRLPLELKGPTDNVGKIVLSRDGKLLAAGCKDKVARIWNLETGELIALEEPAKEYEARSSVNFSGDGKRLVSRRRQGSDFYGNNWVINIWDVSARKSIAMIDKVPPTVGFPIFSPDGKYVAVGLLLQGVTVWEAATGRETFSCRYREGRYVGGIRFSLDGKRLAVGGHDGIHIFDVATHERLAVWPSASSSRCLSFSPDGRRLATGSDEGFVELWDFDSGQLLDTFRGHAGIVEGVAFSPDGTRLASVGADGSLRVWDTNPERVALFISDNASRRYMELSADSRTAFGGIGDKIVRVWNTTTGERQAGPFEHQHIVFGIDLTPDSKRLIVADKGKNVRVWDVGKGTQLLAFKLNREVTPNAAYRSPAGISPDGKWYALPAGDGTIELWNLETGVLSRTLKGFEQLERCQFSPDGSRLLGASLYGAIKVWDITTGAEITSTTFSGMFIRRVCFSPDGKLLAVAGNNRFGSSEARIVDLESGREITLKGHRIAVLDMAFSPDGTRVATASTDKTVGIWDLESGQEILMLKGHTDVVLSVRFSSDGRRLVSASMDRTIRVWDATPLPE